MQFGNPDKYRDENYDPPQFLPFKTDYYSHWSMSLSILSMHAIFTMV